MRLFVACRQDSRGDPQDVQHQERLHPGGGRGGEAREPVGVRVERRWASTAARPLRSSFPFPCLLAFRLFPQLARHTLAHAPNKTKLCVVICAPREFRVSSFAALGLRRCVHPSGSVLGVYFGIESLKSRVAVRLE